MSQGHTQPVCDFSSMISPPDGCDRRQTALPEVYPVRNPRTYQTSHTLPRERTKLADADFGAIKRPNSKLGDKINRWLSGRDRRSATRQKAPPRTPEKSPATVKRDNSCAFQTPVKLLQEISYSRRSDKSNKDLTLSAGQKISEASPASTWYDHASSPPYSSPVFGSAGDDNTNMRLHGRCDSGSLDKTGYTSPAMRHPWNGGNTGLKGCLTSFSELGDTNLVDGKLGEVEGRQDSPTAALQANPRFKALAVENSHLHDKLAGLEIQFEERLRESIEHKVELEVSLRLRIRTLEEDVDFRDWIINELEQGNEWSQRDFSNAEAYKIALERLEYDKRVLEESSRKLEKRNDIITELLGQSPSKLYNDSEVGSPIKGQSNETPRPRSMMPRIHPSPTRRIPDPSLGYLASPSPLKPDRFNCVATLDQKRNGSLSPMDEGYDAAKTLDDVQSIDSGLGDSCSLHSLSDAVSKRSSMRSSTNSYQYADLATWRLRPSSLPSDPSMEYLCRKRKTRRFASGSTQLKPLVLPLLSSSNTMAQPPSPSASYRRDSLEYSIVHVGLNDSCAADFCSQRQRQSKQWAPEDMFGNQCDTTENYTTNMPRVVTERTVDLANFPLLRKSDSEDDQSLPELHDELLNGLTSRNLSTCREECTQLDWGSASKGPLSEGLCGGSKRFLEYLPGRPTEELGTSIPCSLQISSVVKPQSYQNRIIQNDKAEAEKLDATIDVDPIMHGFLGPNLNSFNASPSEDSFSAPGYGDSGEYRFGFGSQVRLGSDDKSLAASSRRLSRPDQTPLLQRHFANVGLQPAMLKAIPITPKIYSSGRDIPSRQQNELRQVWLGDYLNDRIIWMTKQTIFDTISRYRYHLSGLIQDPTALGRRLLANIPWNSRKSSADICWWMFSLFWGVGWKKHHDPVAKSEIEKTQHEVQACCTTLNTSDLNCTSSSAQRHCSAADRPLRLVANKHRDFRHFCDWNSMSNSQDTIQPAEISGHVVRKQNKIGRIVRLLFLWGKFGVAIMLAIAGAVVLGPEEMLRDSDYQAWTGEGAE